MMNANQRICCGKYMIVNRPKHYSFWNQNHKKLSGNAIYVHKQGSAMKEYYAHIADDGRKQTVEDHLEQTARYSEHFASSFDAGEFGRLCGFSHDIGKMSDGFQKRLEGGPVVDHATAGAILLGKEGNVECSVAVISHHSGLPDYGNERTDMPDTPTFCGRIKKNIENKTLDKLHWTGTLPKAPSTPSFENDFDRALWIRMLFSCLVDADYLDTEAFMQNGTVNRSGYVWLFRGSECERLQKTGISDL